MLIIYLNIFKIQSNRYATTELLLSDKRDNKIIDLNQELLMKGLLKITQ